MPQNLPPEALLTAQDLRAGPIYAGLACKGGHLNWTKWIRQTHRWLSIAFTLAVIINTGAVLRGRYNSQLGLLAVFSLALLLFTGLYLFVLPYAGRWRSRASTG